MTVAQAPGQLGRLVFETRALGSPLRLTLSNVRQTDAEAGWQAVKDEFEAVDRDMSAYRSESAISELNRSAGSDELRVVSPRLYEALALADRAWRRTAGRFDARVFAAIQVLGRPGVERIASPPSWNELGGSGICRSGRGHAVAIAAPIDLGGIGKGLALRSAWRRLAPILDRAGGGGLLEAGGDLVGGGPGPTGGEWLIGIDAPDGSADPIAVVGLAVGGVCTSSTEVSTWTGPDGDRVHHLIDPSTGRPGGHGLSSVTVAATDPAWAEVWSKALFLSGPERIGPEARRHGLAAWWVHENGAVEMTPAARPRTRWLGTSPDAR